MQGLMMESQLLISSILKHADTNFPEREIVSVTVDNERHRTTYGECFRRARQLANALDNMGIEHGDRVATLAWNDYRHLEAYYAISGAGYVCHTINPRLFPEQIIYIINHAEDQWIFVDKLVLPLIEGIAEHIPGVKGFIILTDDDNMPETSLANVRSYESLLADQSDHYEWPEFDERTASGLCYTSGTTGNPKGVLYDHRSSVLHGYAAVAPDVMGLSSTDCVLPVVPLFHVNAWGVPYAAPIAGCKLVFPGPKMGDGETLYTLMEEEGVTLSLGVPTVWLALLQYTAENQKKLSSLDRTIIGGAAVPASMIRDFRDKHEVDVIQGWGMTEMSPLGTVSTPKAGTEQLSPDELIDLRAKAGRGIFGVQMRIVDDNGTELPWDGVAYGSLQVKGPWICRDYYRLEGQGDAHTDDGWFDTGDVATIDEMGYMAITDRTKDVIKSGGEWISSIDVENTAMGHEAVAEAAVIGVPHPKWTERPLLIVVPADGAAQDGQAILDWLQGKIAKWWIPDAVVFVDEIPHTATGKIKKIELRKQFADYVLPG